MARIAYLNSKFINFKDAKIHIEDRGLQFADSVYEVVAVFNNKLIDSDFHFSRLRYSLNQLHINYKFKNIFFYKLFKTLIDKNSIANGMIYLQITRGVQPREHAYKKNLKPTLIAYAKKLKFNIPIKNFQGVKAILHEDERWNRRFIKTTNLLPNILAEHEAHKKSAYTAILVKNNKITEGAHSNIWIVKNKVIYTHPSNTDILKGITKTSLKLIINKFKLKLKENSFTTNQLFNADEVFLTSATSFVTPIIKIDTKLINNGKIGEITKYLAEFYYESFLK